MLLERSGREVAAEEVSEQLRGGACIHEGRVPTVQVHSGGPAAVDEAASVQVRHVVPGRVERAEHGDGGPRPVRAAELLPHEGRVEAGVVGYKGATVKQPCDVEGYVLEAGSVGDVSVGDPVDVRCADGASWVETGGPLVFRPTNRVQEDCANLDHSITAWR